MKSIKKSFIVGVVILVFGLLAGCGPHGFHDEDFSARDSKEGGAFCRRWGHHRFGDKDFSDHIMKRIDSRVEDLDLSDSQRKKYEEIRDKIKTNLTEAMEERKRLFKELRSEINREGPDMNVVTSLVKKRLKDMPGSMEGNLDLFVELYNVLDEDQKAQVVEMMRKRMGKD